MIRLEMNRKQEAILAAIIIFAALGVFLLYTGIGTAPAPEPEPPPAAAAEPEPEPAQESMLEKIETHIRIYDSVTGSHLEALDSGEYTFDNPLITVNPYGAAPLSALIIFCTEEPMRISLQIAGKTPDATVSHTFNKFETRHRIPVYGLYPEAVNLVEITAEPRMHSTAEKQSATLMIAAGAISESFPRNIITQNPQELPVDNMVFQPPEIQPGDINPGDIDPDDIDGTADDTVIQRISYEFTSNIGSDVPLYFTFVRKSAFDINGDYRWCYQGFATNYPTSYTPKGNILMITGSFEAEDAYLLELDMLGRIVSYKAVDEEYEITGHGAQYTERRALYND